MATARQRGVRLLAGQTVCTSAPLNVHFFETLFHVDFILVRIKCDPMARKRTFSIFFIFTYPDVKGNNFFS
jgi:hypothetical protein